MSGDEQCQCHPGTCWKYECLGSIHTFPDRTLRGWSPGICVVTLSDGAHFSVIITGPNQALLSVVLLLF